MPKKSIIVRKGLTNEFNAFQYQSKYDYFSKLRLNLGMEFPERLIYLIPLSSFQFV